jgi:hypothetical protein
MSFGFGIQVVTDEDLPSSLAPLIDSTMHRISRLGSFCSNELDDGLSRIRSFSTGIGDTIGGRAASVVENNGRNSKNITFDCSLDGAEDKNHGHITAGNTSISLNCIS